MFSPGVGVWWIYCVENIRSYGRNSPSLSWGNLACLMGLLFWKTIPESMGEIHQVWVEETLFVLLFGKLFQKVWMRFTKSELSKFCLYSFVFHGIWKRISSPAKFSTSSSALSRPSSLSREIQNQLKTRKGFEKWFLSESGFFCRQFVQ